MLTPAAGPVGCSAGFGARHSTEPDAPVLVEAKPPLPKRLGQHSQRGAAGVGPLEHLTDRPARAWVQVENELVPVRVHDRHPPWAPVGVVADCRVAAGAPAGEAALGLEVAHGLVLGD